MISIYFAFTTLSTVGFGDYHPITNFERLLCASIMLNGVLIFSYIMNQFIVIMTIFLELDQDHEESIDLDNFIGVL